MRFGVVLEDSPPLSDRAGARRLHAVATELAARGHEVTVYTTGWWDDSERRKRRDGLTHEAVTVSPARTSFLARVPALLARDRPDAVIVSPSPPVAVLSARLGAAFARSPLVCDWFGDEADGRFEGVAVGAAHRVVTHSEFLRTRVRALGASGDGTSVIPVGVDFSVVEAAVPTDRTDVVYARRLDAEANLESLLLALAELRNRDGWTATVVGDGPERAGYERQAADLGLDDRIRFVGELDRDERVAVYRGAHAFVQTARRELFAEELLWALASGCVGVVEYQGDSSAHELVERRERGIRVTESEALDDAISEAWSLPFRDLDDDFREYDHAAIAGRYLDVLRNCGVGTR